MKRLFSLCAAIPLLLVGCQSSYTPSIKHQEIAESIRMDIDTLSDLDQKPLYKMSEKEVDAYLEFAQLAYPDLRERVVHLARKNIGQPYELYLLGEFPFETYDNQPLYELAKSDCVVFSEHTYAMALTNNWQDFFTMLQRIRYNNGEISVVMRNHYTEPDWNVNNSWLVNDMTNELGGESTRSYTMKIDRNRFLRERYQVDTNWEVEQHDEVYIPAEEVASIEDQLLPGDFVNVIRGPSEKSVWAGHVGLITKADDGTTMFLHSTPPKVREEPLQAYIERGLNYGKENPEKASLKGFKFLRLQENPLENLRAIDGDDAPVVTPLRSKVILADEFDPEEEQEGK